VIYNLYFSNGQKPVKVTKAEIPDWCYTDVEEEAVGDLTPRQSYTNLHGDRWERIR
jgi:hypothetical protein